MKNFPPDTQKRLLSYIKPHRRILALGLICAAAVSGITASIAWFIRDTINSMVDGETGHLNAMCASVLLVFMVKGIFSFGQSYYLSLTANRLATQLRDDIYAHLHSLSLSFFNRRRTGAIMSILTNDVPVLQNAAMSLRDTVSAPITIIVSLTALFVVSPKLAFLSLFFIPCIATVISRISRKMRRISGSVQDKLSDVTTIVEETVAGVRIIKSFAAEDHEVSRFSQENHRTLHTMMRGVRKTAQLRPIVDFIGAFGIALILYVGGNDVAHTNKIQNQEQQQWILAHPGQIAMAREKFPKHGGMDQGQLIMFVVLLNSVAQAASGVGAIATTRAQALASAQRIFEEVLDVEAEIRDKPNAIPLPHLDGNIVFENVSFRYSPDSPDVLRNVSFEVKPGEIVALVGRSGAGKSTLVDLIPRFYDPTEGRILIDGHDIRDVVTASLRRQIGIVPQETWLFAGKLRDNIAYGNREASDEEVKSAAYAANAYFIEGMEQKFDTIVGERGIRLSGGERQRIAIARAILMNPRVLILDEATSSLDASSESLVQEALDTLMKGRTTLVIAHRLSTIINADRILAMRDGQVIEAGTHRELVAAGGYYAQLYETQLRGFD
ncbi:MAG: ABC-type multidrug transport system, ATPase and permease component [Chthonomonadales bacterium]|nr:ABC-type multidrug transport system, ATPase and permease component [Chthonomonadales bacterium]